MKKIILLTLLLKTANVISQSVLFGERNLISKEYSIYFDKEGSIYPNCNIANNSLTKNGGSLKSFYGSNVNDFIKIGKIYQCIFTNFSEENFDSLQRTIVRSISKDLSINKSAGSLTFLIHGFRKPYNPIISEYSSPEDFQMLEDSLRNFEKQSTKFVEIYWDSYYDCCFGKKPKKNKQLFQLFEKAQVNASYVANSFRKILIEVEIDFKKVNIVTHSLGAKIATQALFNYNVLDEKVATPNNQINLCLIAPAISGKETFEKFWDRPTTTNYKVKDNYRVLIAYNVNDFVLKKEYVFLGVSLGPGPYKYGVTTLGCNYDNDATNLQYLFDNNYKSSEIKLINLSKVGSCHYLGACYCLDDNLKNIVDFMEQ